MSAQPTAAPPASIPAGFLNEFFEARSLENWRYLLWRWFRSVLECRSFDFLGSPYQLICMQRQLVQLIIHAAAVYQQLPAGLQHSHPAAHSVPRPEADRRLMQDLGQLWRSHAGRVQYLYAAEASQPALFCFRFFGLMKSAAWQALLNEWLEYALEKDGVAEHNQDIGHLPEALELLLGLCEAAWLWQQQQACNASAAAAAENAPEHPVPEKQDAPVSPADWLQAHHAPLLQLLPDEEAFASCCHTLWQWWRAVVDTRANQWQHEPAPYQDLLPCLIRLMDIAHHYQQTVDAGKDQDSLSSVAAGAALAGMGHPGLLQPATAAFRRFFAFLPLQEWTALLTEWQAVAWRQPSASTQKSMSFLFEAYELLAGLLAGCWQLRQQASAVRGLAAKK